MHRCIFCSLEQNALECNLKQACTTKFHTYNKTVLSQLYAKISA